MVRMVGLTHSICQYAPRATPSVMLSGQSTCVTRNQLAFFGRGNVYDDAPTTSESATLMKSFAKPYGRLCSPYLRSYGMATVPSRWYSSLSPRQPSDVRSSSTRRPHESYCISCGGVACLLSSRIASVRFIRQRTWCVWRRQPPAVALTREDFSAEAVQVRVDVPEDICREDALQERGQDGVGAVRISLYEWNLMRVCQWHVCSVHPPLLTGWKPSSTRIAHDGVGEGSGGVTVTV